VAIAEAVESMTGLRLDLKWPNDLYVGRRKVGGILAEAVATDAVANGLQHVVLGYGLNLTAAAYPAEISGRATSIESELGRPIDRALLLVETLTTLARRYADLVDGRYDAILDAWRLRAPASIGSRVAWTTTSGRRSGMTMGIDDHGALLVKSDGGVERIVAGELTWL
jgi:BirA family biotin operon repressor/biotin-[acetyl-CoA-carboxylase] ligase